MTSIDELARRAGDDLNNWNPDLPESDPSGAIARIRRRRATARVAVGGMAAALVLGVGIWQGAASERDGVVTRPAGQNETPPTTGEDPDATSLPSTTAPTDTPATSAPTDTPVTTAVPAVPGPVVPTPADPGEPTTCTGRLSDGSSYVVDLPAGWYANEAFGNVSACTHFAPVPLEFSDYDEDAGWASSNDVVLTLTPPSLPEGMTWEQYLEVQPNEYSGPIDAEHTTIAGQAAVREERIDPQTGGRWVRWKFLLGGDQGFAVTDEGSPNGTPYETSVAALDSIVRSIRIDG